jgi:hypothetical protein
MTPEEIRAKLGLIEPLDHQLQVRWKNANYNLEHERGQFSAEELSCRRTGRTTEMLVQTLSHVANTGRNALILASNKDQADIIGRRAGDWAFELGLDPRKIESRAVQPTDSKAAGVIGRYLEDLFWDHVVTDGI